MKKLLMTLFLVLGLGSMVFAVPSNLNGVHFANDDDSVVSGDLLLEWSNDAPIPNLF